MAVIRVEKNKNYTCMSNYHLRDKNLSLKAKGLMSVILSLPDNWKYSMAGLVAICKEGESSVKAAFKELEKTGFVTVSKLYPNQTKSGRIEYVYTIHEEPIKQESCIQGVENLGVVSQEVENQGQLSTEQSSTDKPNTKNKTKKEREEVPFAEIIAYLNERTGRSYRNVEGNRKHIRARWNEYPDLTAEQRMEMFRHCIDAMCSVWLGDGKMEMYLRPQTLFGSKFEGYANQPIMAKRQKPQRQMDLSECPEPRIGSKREDNRTGKMEVYKGNGVWEEYVSDYVPLEGDVDIDF